MESKNNKIKAVVFDFGGVIEINEGDIWKRITELLNISPEDFYKVYFQYNHLANVENMSFEDMLLKVIAVFDNSEEIKNKVKSYLKDWTSKHKINLELLNFFPLLKQQGLKLGIFSNSSRELRDRLTREGISELVDEVVISGEIGFQKPHKEAFEVLFEKLKLRPDVIVFIDDTPKSLEKAMKSDIFQSCSKIMSN